ncbi:MULTISPECIES: translation initiation factor 2 [unclassified Psychrobacillus]|uniref:translation initiation factor 2 n=1 Tax=unclassified Psychrobacillus TaxID=2636677 RepID=UPI0012AEFEA9|nr:translation initiation factor 2 [Bacillus sp. N3536]
MKNNNNFKNGQGEESTDILVAKLAFFGGTLATLGDGITALAAGIALQELEKSNAQNSSEQSNQTAQLEQMQKQINELTRKLNNIERSKG